MNKQIFSMITGLMVVFGHVVITFLFMFYFNLPSGAKLSEITLPLTVAYVTSIVMWFFKTGGLVTSGARVGKPLVILVALIVFSMLAGLFAVPYIILKDPSGTLDELNNRYVMLETAFGGIFGIVMSELFGYNRGGPAND